MIRARFAAAALCWLALSLAGKAVRYASPSPDAEVQALAPVESFLRAFGWERADPGALRDSRHLYAFKKLGCGKPVFIAMLGTGAETVPLLRQRFQHDLIFFENGTAVEAPVLWRGSFMQAANAVSRLAGLAVPKDHAVFAVSPAPAASPADCAPPTLSAWADFLSSAAL